MNTISAKLILSSITVAMLATTTFGAKPKTVRLKQVTLQDPGMRNMDSHTILVPHNWKVAGKAFWPEAKFFRVFPSQHVNVTTASGAEIEIGPNAGFYDFRPSQYAMQYLGAKRPQPGQASNGKPVFYRPDTIEEWETLYEKFIIPNSHPDATDVSVKAEHAKQYDKLIEKQLAAIRAQEKQMAALLANAGMKNFSEGKVMVVKCEYTENNITFEELHTFKMFTIGSQSQVGTELLWSIENNIIFRGAKGKLEKEMPDMIKVVCSLKPTLQWATMLAKHIAKMNKDDRDSAERIRQIMAQNHADIMQMQHNTYKTNNLLNDRGHNNLINSINEVEVFKIDSTTTVQLPAGYEHVYHDGNGNYILTNDVLYNPNVDATSTTNWIMLK